MVALETIKVVFGVFAFLCAQSHGFTVDIIHRDSPDSPFRNPSKSRADYAMDALLRSQSRVARMKRHAATTTPGLRGSSAANKFAKGLECDASDYMMKFSIGTPPVERFAMVDTGSDLAWTQCEPCKGVCFPQDMPLFDPSKSSSYTRLPYDSPICREGGLYSCDNSSNLCCYNYAYADASHTNGDLAYDTLALGGTSFPNFVFGCGFNNSGIFWHLITGIFGLGTRLISFIKQANIGRFSYCLPWYYEANVSTHIKFGSDAVITDPSGVVSTPLVDPESGYLIALENLSVGGKTLLSKPLEESSMVVDSGTALIHLPHELHEALIADLRSAVKSTPVSDPGGTYKLCCNASDIATEVFPTVAAHFAGGAVVPFSLKSMLNFLVFDGGVVCMPFVGGGYSILGNIAQMDYKISGFDLDLCSQFIFRILNKKRLDNIYFYVTNISNKYLDVFTDNKK